MRKVGGVLLLVCLLVAVAGCGGKSDNEKKAEAAAKSGEGTITCEGKALSGDSGLPAGFPVLDGVTFVKAEDKGPSASSTATPTNRSKASTPNTRTGSARRSSRSSSASSRRTAGTRRSPTARRTGRRRGSSPFARRATTATSRYTSPLGLRRGTRSEHDLTARATHRLLLGGYGNVKARAETESGMPASGAVSALPPLDEPGANDGRDKCAACSAGLRRIGSLTRVETQPAGSALQSRRSTRSTLST